MLSGAANANPMGTIEGKIGDNIEIAAEICDFCRPRDGAIKAVKQPAQQNERKTD